MLDVHSQHTCLTKFCAQSFSVNGVMSVYPSCGPYHAEDGDWVHVSPYYLLSPQQKDYRAQATTTCAGKRWPYGTLVRTKMHGNPSGGLRGHGTAIGGQ